MSHSSTSNSSNNNNNNSQSPPITIFSQPSFLNPPDDVRGKRTHSQKQTLSIQEEQQSNFLGLNKAYHLAKFVDPGINTDPLLGILRASGQDPPHVRREIIPTVQVTEEEIHKGLADKKKRLDETMEEYRERRSIQHVDEYRWVIESHDRERAYHGKSIREQSGMYIALIPNNTNTNNNNHTSTLATTTTTSSSSSSSSPPPPNTNTTTTTTTYSAYRLDQWIEFRRYVDTNIGKEQRRQELLRRKLKLGRELNARAIKKSSEEKARARAEKKGATDVFLRAESLGAKSLAFSKKNQHDTDGGGGGDNNINDEQPDYNVEEIDHEHDLAIDRREFDAEEFADEDYEFDDDDADQAELYDHEDLRGIENNETLVREIDDTGDINEDSPILEDVDDELTSTSPPPRPTSGVASAPPPPTSTSSIFSLSVHPQQSSTYHQQQQQQQQQQRKRARLDPIGDKVVEALLQNGSVNVTMENFVIALRKLGVNLKDQDTAQIVKTQLNLVAIRTNKVYSLKQEYI
jgi:hypothetical protein